MAVKEIEQQAEDAGLKWATIRRAKDALRIEAYHKGFGPGAAWHWRLRTPQVDDDSPIDAIDAHIPEVSVYGESEHLCDDPNGLLQQAAADEEVGVG